MFYAKKCRKNSCANIVSSNSRSFTNMYCDSCMNTQLDAQISNFKFICSHDDCQQEGLYGATTISNKLYCEEHKVRSKKLVKKPRCTRCSNFALYKNILYNTFYCLNHKNLYDLNHTHESKHEIFTKMTVKICVNTKCENVVHYKSHRYCKIHILEYTEVSNKNDSCAYPFCDRIGYFHLPNLTYIKYCKVHKLRNSVKSDSCCHELGCLAVAKYNYPTFNKPKYCNAHKKSNMIPTEKSNEEGNEEGNEKSKNVVLPSYNELTSMID